MKISKSLPLEDPLRIIRDTSGDVSPEDFGLGFAISCLHFDVQSMRILATILRDGRDPESEQVEVEIRDSEGRWRDEITCETRRRLNALITTALLSGQL